MNEDYSYTKFILIIAIFIDTSARNEKKKIISLLMSNLDLYYPFGRETRYFSKIRVKLLFKMEIFILFVVLLFAASGLQVQCQPQAKAPGDLQRLFLSHVGGRRVEWRKYSGNNITYFHTYIIYVYTSAGVKCARKFERWKKQNRMPPRISVI